MKTTNSLWNWTDVDIPGPRSYTSAEVHSACNNGYSSDVKTFGYACPHMMLLSDDMILASRYDNLSEEFIYATAGGQSDSLCGACYQIQLLDAEEKWIPTFKQLVVQIINSGFHVIANQLDIFMGGGGFGYFTACNSDCSSKYCQGGCCAFPMYGGNFDQWTNAQYNDPNICYSGGIKWLDRADNETLLSLCKGLDNNAEFYKSNVTRDSCYRSNLQLYHQNFVSTNLLRVKCPDGLIRLTGMSRDDNDDYPPVNIINSLSDECRGDRMQGRYCITTMQDCCKPSCSWSGKGGSSTWSRVDTCDKDGYIIL